MPDMDGAIDRLQHANGLEQRARRLRLEAETEIAAVAHELHGGQRYYPCLPRGARKRDMPPGSVLQECPYDHKPRGCWKLESCCFQHRTRGEGERPRQGQRKRERQRAGSGGSFGSEGAPGGAGGGSSRNTWAGPIPPWRPQAQTGDDEAQAATVAAEVAEIEQRVAVDRAARYHLFHLLLQNDNSTLEASVLTAIHHMLGA